MSWRGQSRLILLLVLAVLAAATVFGYFYCFPATCVSVFNQSGGVLHGAAVHFGQTVEALDSLQPGDSVTVSRRLYDGEVLSIDDGQGDPPIEIGYAGTYIGGCFDVTVLHHGISVRMCDFGDAT